MKFIKKFPEMNTKDDQRMVDGDTIVRGKDALPCAICGDPTQYISVSFESYFCSEYCLDRMWRDYEKALRRTI